MVWIFEERPDSRETTLAPDTITLKYVGGRTGDELTMAAYAISATPLIHNNLYRQSMSIKPLGGGMWNVDVPYGNWPNEPSYISGYSSYRVHYDTTGGTARLTQALAHIASYAPPGKTAPAHNGALNVAADGRPEGTDVVVPSFKWTEEHTMPILTCGWPFSQVLKAMTGHVNAATFRGFPQGEVLFLGATGSYSSEASTDKETQLTFSFEQQDSITNVTYDAVTGVSKIGWEYIWFEHSQKDDDTAKRLKSTLLAVHREKLYYTADFSLLQIGS
jgi:hypothetical protein